MAKYLAVVKPLLKGFRAVKVEQVGKVLNSHINTLAGLTLIFKPKKSDELSQ